MTEPEKDIRRKRHFMSYRCKQLKFDNEEREEMVNEIEGRENIR